jgi:hypothetical protein
METSTPSTHPERARETIPNPLQQILNRPPKTGDVAWAKELDFGVRQRLRRLRRAEVLSASNQAPFRVITGYSTDEIQRKLAPSR